MWTISNISVPNNRRVTLYGGLPNQGSVMHVNDTFGPGGALYSVCIENFGCIMLRDVGNIPGPGAWAVEVNGTQNWFYDGRGNLSIQVSADGSFAMSGGSSTVSGNLMPVMPNCNAMMSDAGGYCFCVLSASSGTSKQLSVPANSDSLIFTIMSPYGAGPLAGSSLVITGPNGIVIDKNTAPTSSITIANGPFGLVSARVKTPTAGNWTATVNNTMELSGYLYGSVTAASNNIDSAWNAYRNASYNDKSQITSLGLFIHPSAQITMTPDEWFRCALCKTEYYLLLGVLVIIQPEILTWPTIGKIEAGSKIAKYASDVLSLDDGVARRVLDAICFITDPLEWPKNICKLTRQCS